ncbi:DUF4062 domain-containing protein [Lactococcus cremoris]|uniref:DUF4062 domain-containing protein n=1 Tax=Lactococcus lactis subsp. cremoris TaxID=1359 RepID=UPI0037BFAB95
MEKKYQVFISSTYNDLKDERQEVVESVLNAGHIPAGMEIFKPGSSQEVTIKRWIEQSDIYLLLLGPRYGTLNETGISYTQWEYELAKKLGKPMFSLVLTDSYIQKMVENKKIKVSEVETSNTLYKKFKEEVMSSLVGQVDHPAIIRSVVADSIREIESNYSEKLEGWIKGSFLDELLELRSDKEKLSMKLLSRQEEVIDMQRELDGVKDEYIGSFTFTGVREVLNSTIINEQDIEKVIIDVVNKKYSLERNFIESPVNESLSDKEFDSIKGVSALEYLVKSKDSLLTSGLNLKLNNLYDRVVQQSIVTKWEQFSLVNKTNFNGRIPRDVYYLNNYGKKFIAMVDLSTIKNQE